MLLQIILAITLLNPKVNFNKAYNYATLIEKYSCKNSLDPMLTAVVMFRESRYKPTVINKYTQAIGLMQIMPSHSSDPEKLLMPEYNIAKGTQLLRLYIDRCNGSIEGGLSLYNGRGKCKSSIFSKQIFNLYKKVNTLKTSKHNLYKCSNKPRCNILTNFDPKL